MTEFMMLEPDFLLIEVLRMGKAKLVSEMKIVKGRVVVCKR